MSLPQIAFLVTAAATLVTAFLVVTTRNLFHAALWLIATLFGVAVTFVLLEAGFLAVAQVALYIGAIAILIIFAVMLTQRIMRTDVTQSNRQWAVSAVVAAAFFVGLCLLVQQMPGWTQPPAPLSPVPADSLVALGLAMVDPSQYALTFEVASVLLLAAMVGSIMVAREKK